MGTRTRSLTAAEIAVSGRCTTFTRLHHIAVDPNAHGAAGVRPFKPCLTEDTVEAFFLCLTFNRRGTWRYQSGHLADTAGENRRGSAQVFDARVGTGADEDPVNCDFGQFLAGHDRHVV